MCCHGMDRLHRQDHALPLNVMLPRTEPMLAEQPVQVRAAGQAAVSAFQGPVHRLPLCFRRLRDWPAALGWPLPGRLAIGLGPGENLLHVQGRKPHAFRTPRWRARNWCKDEPPGNPRLPLDRAFSTASQVSGVQGIGPDPALGHLRRGRTRHRPRRGPAVG